jgi:hypothetical protein
MWRTLVSRNPNLWQGEVFIVIEREKVVSMELIMPGMWMSKDEKRKHMAIVFWDRCHMEMGPSTTFHLEGRVVSSSKLG